MAKKKKKKILEKFDQGNNVRAIARERIGTVPSSKVFKSKKKDLDKQEEEKEMLREY